MEQKKFHTIIVGGGLSGLTVAHRIALDDPQHDFCLLEATPQCGGVIQSFQQEGIVAEPGPHGFLDNCKESQQLLQETGLDKLAIKASLKEFVRYVYHQGQLKMIAQSPGKILTAPLISPLAKLKVLRDVYKPYLDGEPSVAQWGAYRFGEALLPYLDAAFTGTYAGDIEKLTIDGVMPGLRAVEKEHGSIIRGVLKKRRTNPKKAKSSSGLPAMTSFPGGMRQLVDTLIAELVEGKNLFYNSSVKAIAKEGDKGWRVITENGSYSAERLILAVPVNTALALLMEAGDFAPPTPPVQQLPQAAIANIALTFSKGVNIPPGFGFLVPEQEQKFILGALFSSNMFAGRAPANTHLVEVLIGGRRHPERLTLDSAEIIAAATKDIQEILQIAEPPLTSTILPAVGSFPQAEKGYSSLMRWREEVEEAADSLFLCGFGWQGIGINDMIRGSFRVAGKLLAGEGVQKKAEIKGIYF